MKNFLKLIAFYLVISACATFGLILLFGSAPKTIVGWGLLFLFALPITVFGEKIGEIIFRKEIDSENRKLSPKRMLYLFIVFGLIFFVVILISTKLESSALGSFISKHF